MLDVGARLWLQVNEREYEGEDNGQCPCGVIADLATELAANVRQLIKDVFSEIERECPTVRKDEFSTLLSLNEQAFAPLVSA